MTSKKSAARKTREPGPAKGRPGASSIELDRFLPYRLAVLSNAISRGLGEVYGDRFQLTIADWRILANLGQAGPLYAGELAERSSLDKPKVTRALQRMEAAGTIVRTIDIEDRRQARLSLTDKGRAMYSEVAAIALEWEAELLAPLSPSDRQNFEAVLRKLQVRVDHMRGQYSAGQSKPAQVKGSTEDEAL